MPTVIGFDDQVLDNLKKKVTCKGCAAIIEYMPGDVMTRTYTIIGDDSGHTYVACPNCGKDARIRSW